MKIGTVTVSSAQWELTGTSVGNYASGLDEALPQTLLAGDSFAYIGPLFEAGSVEAIKLDSAVPAKLPDAIDFAPQSPLAVCALCLRDETAARLYLPAQAGSFGGRWVSVPRMAEYYAMAASDRNAQRQAWITALSAVATANWPKGIAKKNLGVMSAASLRILLGYLGQFACRVTGVNQPAQMFRGAQTRGFTLPLLSYPISEPDCYIRVISGREGLLESINAYDLGAGVSLGSIQFNVHRAAIFQFLHSFDIADAVLFKSCFGQFGWTPKLVTIMGRDYNALSAIDISGNPVELIGRDADHGRNCGYFQSGLAGHDDFGQINAGFRKSIATAFRDAVIWPHVQEKIIDISAEWLRPGLSLIEAAGIAPVDKLRPDRDAFVLKALLLSAYVRYSACLAPLLNALKPYASVSAKLGALKSVLLASGSWSNCSHDRRNKLADRLDAQKPDAVAAWEVINRLAESYPGASAIKKMAMMADVSFGSETDHDSCEHDAAPDPERFQFWFAQASIGESQLAKVVTKFKSLTAKSPASTHRRKRSGKSARSKAAKAEPRIEFGDLVGKSARGGRVELAIVDAIDGHHLHVRTLTGSYKRWRGTTKAGSRQKGIQVIATSMKLAHEVAALQSELVFADPTLAIPPFSAGERSIVQEPLLSPASNGAAFTWNQHRHPAVSGVMLDRIAATLGAYVDFSSVKSAITAAHGGGAATDNAVLVEAIHQFQCKTYAETGQHDGRCGESTLDNLGLYLGRPGLNQVDVANPAAQAHLNNVNSKLASAADNPSEPARLNATNWFRHMTAPAFLGQTFSNGIHAVLLRRLRTAERHLLSLPAYQGMTPVKLGWALGIEEFHRGSRPAATGGSMHTFGLATDINYTANPWIEGNEIVQVLRRARRLVSGASLEGGTSAASLLHSKLAGQPTAVIYDFMWTLDRDFRSYLTLKNDMGGLMQLLEGHQQNGTPGIFQAGETIDEAGNRWRNTITTDLGKMGSDDGFVNRDPRNGFLGLAKDLVIALRDFGCLAWGASDFGPNASGDIMHFDCRNTGLGRVVNKGFAPPERKCSP